MEAESVDDTITMMRHQTIDEMVESHIPAKAYAEQWDMDGIWLSTISSIV